MDHPPSLAFHRLLNGDSDTFRLGARYLFFLDGHQELLNIRRLPGTGENAEIIYIGSFRNGKECTLFETNVPMERSWRWQCNGNTIIIANREDNTGTAIIYENGSFRSENVHKTRMGLEYFIRAGGSDYFAYKNEIMVMASNSTSASLQFELLPSCRTYSVHVVRQRIVICQMFDESSIVIMYELDNCAYRERGTISVPFKNIIVTTLDDSIILLGESELAIVDCTIMEATRFTFSQVPGKISKIAARSVGDGTLEIYFSSEDGDHCHIHKASLSLLLRKSLLDLTNRLQAAELSGEQQRTELQKYAAHEKETNEKIAALNSSVAQEKKENAEMKKTVANLQASLETLERKYSNVFLLLSRKNSGA